MPERAYEPKKLSERHRNVLRLYALGYTIDEIAKKLNYTKAAVGYVVNSKAGQFHTELIRNKVDEEIFDAAKRVRKLAPMALDVIEDILSDSEVPSAVRLRAAQDALDRAGYGAVKKMDIRSTSLSLTPNDLDEIKMQALSRAMGSGVELPSSVIDTTIADADTGACGE